MKLARAVLTTASDEFIPRPKYRAPCVTRFLAQYITYIPHLPELVPFVQGISLGFIWMDQDNYPHKDIGFAREVLQVVTSILTWLKAIDPPPDILTQRWNTYRLAALWETMPVESMVFSTQSLLSLSPEMLHKVQTRMARFLPLPLAKYQQLAVQSPRCTRILQAMWLLDGCDIRFRGLSLSHIRFLLDESWDEIMNTISLLHTTTYTAAKPFSAIAAAMITILAHSLELHPGSASALFCDLACRCLRFITSNMLSAVQDLHNANYSRRCQVGPDLRSCWGIIIRYSPQPNPELLGLLQEFAHKGSVPPSNGFSTSKCNQHSLPTLNY
ncbi:hypothetical protein B0H16DRAFT_1560972 [Mycena metata]|uniref:Uncharacterized protein n=1 Tax=Mycena metata TaxID=1033252 RepID=A0AAD7IHX5_9AGAR|nr:hypothetical protein B0H16DRAFT_1560972 [Mycena metata]